MLEGFLLGIEFFSRVVIVMTFLLAIMHKLLHFQAFERTIRSVLFMPAHLIRFAAIILCVWETTVVVGLTTARQVELPAGFGVAILLLLLYTTVLIVVLAKKLQFACNCFEQNNRPARNLDIWRNGVLLLCAVAGFVIARGVGEQPDSLSILAKLLIGAVAIIFTLTWIQIGEIVDLWRAETRGSGKGESDD